MPTPAAIHPAHDAVAGTFNLAAAGYDSPALRAAHLAELAPHAAEKGLWLDVTVHFAGGVKPALRPDKSRGCRSGIRCVVLQTGLYGIIDMLCFHPTPADD